MNYIEEMDLNEKIEQISVDSYVIVKTNYGETRGCQVIRIKYHKISLNYYIAKVVCRAKNNFYHTNEYDINDCRPDKKMNRKMKLKRIIG